MKDTLTLSQGWGKMEMGSGYLELSYYIVLQIQVHKIVEKLMSRYERRACVYGVLHFHCFGITCYLK